MRAQSVVPGILLLLALAAPSDGRAQETQVPLDEAGQIEEIDRALAQRLGIFGDDYPDLQVVRLYQAGAGEFILEVTARRDGRTTRQRVPMSAEEVRSLRAAVTAALSAHAPEIALDQDGRFLLLTGTTLLGLGYYGWAVPFILDIESGRGTLASYMLTAGASFVGPYLYTRDRPVTYGMANAGFWGGSRGIIHGALLASLIDPTPSGRMVNAVAMGTSLAEGLTGYAWAHNTGMSAGHAHTLGNFGDFGLSAGGFALATIQPDEERVAFATLLGGAAAGLALGPARAQRLPYTWGDAEIQRAGFYLGSVNGFVLWDVLLGNSASDDDLRVLGPLLLGGSVAGMLAADRVLVGHDFSAGQGILVDLGTVAGGLLGMGVAVLLGPENVDDPTGLFILGALGADLGFAATFLSLSDDARRRAAAGTSRIDLQVNPAALALLQTPLDRMEIPLLTLHYRF